MELVMYWMLGAIVVFVVNAMIIRFMVGTDRIMHYQRRQIRLLEKLLEHYNVDMPDDDNTDSDEDA